MPVNKPLLFSNDGSPLSLSLTHPISSPRGCNILSKAETVRLSGEAEGISFSLFLHEQKIALQIWAYSPKDTELFGIPHRKGWHHSLLTWEFETIPSSLEEEKHIFKCSVY